MKKAISRILVTFLALIIFSVSGFSHENHTAVAKHATVNRPHHKGHHKHHRGHSHRRHAGRK